MVDFRNAVHADWAPEIAPFPAGLNDCVSGLKWVHANAAALGIDPARIVVTGERTSERFFGYYGGAAIQSGAKFDFMRSAVHWQFRHQ